LRCPYCGNENPEGNRFCGMCGGTLLAAKAQPQQVASSGHTSPSAPASTSRPRSADPPRQPDPPRPEPATDAPASISGPSFLGLNDPAPALPLESRRKGAGLSITPDSSRNLDYLLEDDDEPKGGGAGKFLLILIALALAVGLGYLRWKNHGFGWLSPSANKPAAVQTDSSTPDSPTPAPSSTTPASQAAPTAAAPSANTTAQPPTNSTLANAAGAPSNPAPSPSTTAAKSDSATPPAATTEPAPDNATAASNTPPAAAPATDSSAKQPSASTSNSQAAASSDSAAPDQPGTASSATATPPPALKPVPRIDTVAEAQKYLYGRGVPQDCDRGLRLLKPAANRSEPKAMIEMGALYSAGLCTPHDLPTAYRWFALALRKDPSNEAVQTDLSKLWSEMTQPERQLAIKLTQ